MGTALSNIQPVEILEIAAARFGVAPEALRGPVGRLSPESRMRVLVAYLVRKHTLATLTEVGGLLGAPASAAKQIARDMVLKGEQWVEGEEPMTVMCELIERDIDKLHGERPLPPPAPDKRTKTPTCPHCGARRQLETGVAA